MTLKRFTRRLVTLLFALPLGCGDADPPAAPGPISVTIDATAEGCDEDIFDDIGSVVLVAKSSEGATRSGCYSVRSLEDPKDLETALREARASVDATSADGLELFIEGYDGAGCRSDQLVLCGNSVSNSDGVMLIEVSCGAGSDSPSYAACVAALPPGQ